MNTQGDAMFWGVGRLMKAAQSDYHDVYIFPENILEIPDL